MKRDPMRRRRGVSYAIASAGADAPLDQTFGEEGGGLGAP